jgi:hypothetical protein
MLETRRHGICYWDGIDHRFAGGVMTARPSRRGNAPRAARPRPPAQRKQPSKNLQEKLHESLEETFPASDPIAPALPEKDPGDASTR